MSYSAQVLVDSPKVFLQLDEATGNWVDSGSNGVTFTAGTVVRSKAGPSAAFGAISSSAADAPASLASIPTGLTGTSVTAECWVNVPAGNVNGPFINIGSDANGWAFGIGGTSLDNAGHQLIGLENGVAFYQTGVTLETGWHHVVAIRDASTNVLFYVDGVLVHTWAIGSVIAATTITGVGGSASRYLHGDVDIAVPAIYPAILTQTRVVAHYREGLLAVDGYAIEVAADSPLAYWRLGDSSGTTAADSSGNVRNATYAGTYTLAQTGLLTDDADTAVTVNGGRAEKSSATWMDANYITVEAMIKPTTIVAGGGIIDRDANGTRSWQFRIRSDGKLELIIWTTTVSAVTIVGATALTVGNTYHVAFTFDGTNAKVYVNGIQDASSAISGTMKAATDRITVGWGDQNSAFIGTLDEAAVYGTALSAGRIKTHWMASLYSGLAAGDQAVNVGLPTETDTSLALTPPQSVGVGLPTEADSVLAPTITLQGDLPIYPLIIEENIGSTTLHMNGFTLTAGDWQLDSFASVDKMGWLQWTTPDDFSGVVRFSSTNPLALYSAAGALLSESVSGSIRNDDAEPGVVYLLGVAHRAADSLDPVVSWFDATSLGNDAFDDALEIDSVYGSDVIDLTNSTTEVGETIPTGATGTSWSIFVADSTNELTLSVDSDGEVPFTVTVWRGTTLSGLILVDTATSSGDPATLTFNVTSGLTYYIQIGAGDLAGEFLLSWNVAPIIVSPELPYEYVRVEVYDRTGVTMLSEIPRRVGVTWQEQLNSVGAGSLGLYLPDPILSAYPDMFEWGNIIKFWLGDVCVFGFEIRARKTVWVSGSEWSGWTKEVSGPSVQYLLNEFIVMHDGPRRNGSLDTRNYSWPSLRDEWYDAGDWNDPYQTATRQNPPGDQYAVAKKRSKWAQPKNWPDPTARWMFGPGEGVMTRAHGGRHYWRHDINLLKKVHVRLFAAGDEAIRIYVDGEEVMAADGVETGYTETTKVDLVLDAGEHTIALFLASTNSVGGDGNDAITFTMMNVNKRGKARGVVLNSGPGWECWHGPNVPGWNRAQVMRNCVNEAVVRGNTYAQKLNLDFGPDADTDGRAWTDRWHDEVSIGATGLELQGMLSEGNGFDVWVDPLDLKLKAWRRRGVDKSHSVTLEPGRNLLDWEITEVDEVKNDYLIKYNGGWLNVRSASSVRTYGNRETFVSLGNSNDRANAKKTMVGVSQGLAWALRRAGTPDLRIKNKDQPSGGLIAVDGARPFLDFNVGDTIGAPDVDAALSPHRVLSLSASEDSDGTLSYDQELELIR